MKGIERGILALAPIAALGVIALVAPHRYGSAAKNLSQAAEDVIYGSLDAMGLVRSHV